MNGENELNRMDLHMLDLLRREWETERLNAARNENLLRGHDGYKTARRPGRMLLIALGVALLAALLVGLAVAGAASPGGLGMLL